MAYFAYQNHNIYYDEAGSGEAVAFLHGNTASSKMFDLLLPLYLDDFRVIRIDFLGHGQSDRLDAFPCTLWQEEALQTIALMQHLDCGRMSLVGTSGGAYVALHAALLRPDLVRRVVADSFGGRTVFPGFAEALVAERSVAVTDPEARMFYQWCQGENWAQVVEADTQALVQLAGLKVPVLPASLPELKAPLLLMGSAEDAMLRPDWLEEYRQIQALIPGASLCQFETGGHPAIATNAEAAAEAIRAFLLG